MQSRDAVLEGANPNEIAALSRLGNQPGYMPSPDLAGSLQAKGWIDQAGDVYLLTITGRTLIERPLTKGSQTLA
ncbi:hypothetical protein [Devosia nitrariae]|uniref:Uncharacterized protein n=1 Tax=Devosia nitrariae TaxID=2071872 RepID=A0ABQ5W0X1_9HYPH|nr:hypothetical protein [Devosia nitrariae]GLQ53637.1 hypothetical protein GCM10010862_08960 [Devosia nitrariae]